MKVSLNTKGAKGLGNALKNAANKEKIAAVVRFHTGELAEKSQRKVPVDTGHLKRSMITEVSADGEEGTVKYTADYAGYIEKGTRFMPAQPYLEPALNEVREKFLEDLAKAGEG